MFKRNAYLCYIYTFPLCPTAVHPNADSLFSVYETSLSLSLLTFFLFSLSPCNSNYWRLQNKHTIIWGIISSEPACLFYFLKSISLWVSFNQHCHVSIIVMWQWNQNITMFDSFSFWATCMFYFKYTVPLKSEWFFTAVCPCKRKRKWPFHSHLFDK